MYPDTLLNFAQRHARWAAVLFGPLLACSSTEADNCGTTISVSQAIRFETPDGGLPHERFRSLVFALQFQDVNDPGAPLSHVCTGTRIAPGLLVTAAHCTRELEPSELRLTRSDANTASRTFDGSNCEPNNAVEKAPETVTVLAFVVHPSLDIALLAFEEPDVSPISAQWQSPPPEGASAIITGYGLTEDNSLGKLRAIEVKVLAIDDDIRVQAIDGGACVGDSGGPLFTSQGDGPLLIHGVLSTGSASCVGNDYYTPLNAAADWLTIQASTLSPQ